MRWRGGLWTALVLTALLAAACARKPPALPAGTEICIHSERGMTLLASGDVRGPALLAELKLLAAAARPAAGELSRRELAIALARGALEYRFAALQHFSAAGGDTLSASRLLLVLGMEPLPPGGEEGLLLLVGNPDFDPQPLVSSRPRERLLAILEGR